MARRKFTKREKPEDITHEISSANPSPGVDDVQIRFKKFDTMLSKITLPIDKAKSFAEDLCAFLNIPTKKGNNEDKGG